MRGSEIQREAAGRRDDINMPPKSHLLFSYFCLYFVDFFAQSGHKANDTHATTSSLCLARTSSMSLSDMQRPLSRSELHSLSALALRGRKAEERSGLLGLALVSNVSARDSALDAIPMVAGLAAKPLVACVFCKTQNKKKPTVEGARLSRNLQEMGDWMLILRRPPKIFLVANINPKFRRGG